MSKRFGTLYLISLLIEAVGIDSSIGTRKSVLYFRSSVSLMYNVYIDKYCNPISIDAVFLNMANVAQLEAT